VEKPETLKIPAPGVESAGVIPDGLSSSLAGLEATSQRLGVSAHNLANLTTQGVHPLRSQQMEDARGLPRVRAQRTRQPESVDLARERVDQLRAGTDFLASLRALDMQLELLGSLVDLRG